jgi:anti-sigma B factor antagonist
VQQGTTVQVDHTDDGRNASATIFRFRGDISSASQDALLGTYSRLMESERGQLLVLDFTKVEYINSSGIALVIQLLMKAGKAGAKVALFGLTPHFQKVFAMVGIAKYAGMYPDEAAALAN